MEVQGANTVGQLSVADGEWHVVSIYTTGDVLGDVRVRVDGVEDVMTPTNSSFVIDTASSSSGILFSRSG